MLLIDDDDDDECDIVVIYLFIFRFFFNVEIRLAYKSKLSWEQENNIIKRCKRKPSAKHGVFDQRFAAGPPTTEKAAKDLGKVYVEIYRVIYETRKT